MNPQVNELRRLNAIRAKAQRHADSCDNPQIRPQILPHRPKTVTNNATAIMVATAAHRILKRGWDIGITTPQWQDLQREAELAKGELE